MGFYLPSLFAKKSFQASLEKLQAKVDCEKFAYISSSSQKRDFISSSNSIQAIYIIIVVAAVVVAETQ